MPIVSCPMCGLEISSKSRTCPHCGFTELAPSLEDFPSSVGNNFGEVADLGNEMWKDQYVDKKSQSDVILEVQSEIDNTKQNSNQEEQEESEGDREVFLDSDKDKCHVSSIDEPLKADSMSQEIAFSKVIQREHVKTDTGSHVQLTQQTGVDNLSNKPKRKKQKKWIVIGIVSILFIFAIVFILKQNLLNNEYQEIYNSFCTASSMEEVCEAGNTLNQFMTRNPKYEVDTVLCDLNELANSYCSANEGVDRLRDVMDGLSSSIVGTNIAPDFEDLGTKLLTEAVNDYEQYKEKQYKEFLNYVTSCPLQIVQRYNVDYNSIGTPEVHILVKNNSSKAIDQFNAYFLCYNNFDEPVYKYGISDKGNLFGATASCYIGPGNYWGHYNYWTMYGLDNTTKVVEVITKIHFTDGTTWELPKECMAIAMEKYNE